MPKSRTCPICGEPALTVGDPSFPFCSRRCKLVDLGNWLGENYRFQEDHERPSTSDGDWPEGG
jgi:hypothetical protein